MILSLTRTQEVDIGLATTAYTYERLLEMDFVDPVDYSPVVMVYRRPAAQLSTTVLGPLSLDLLTALSICMAFVVLAVWTLELGGGRCRQDEARTWRRGEEGEGTVLWRGIRALDTATHVVGAALLLKGTLVCCVQ